jgi:hypothetical protein
MNVLRFLVLPCYLLLIFAFPFSRFISLCFFGLVFCILFEHCVVAHFCLCCCMCVDSSAAERLVSVEEKVVVAEERPPPTPPGPHGMLKSAFVHCFIRPCSC